VKNVATDVTCILGIQGVQFIVFSDGTAKARSLRGKSLGFLIRQAADKPDLLCDLFLPSPVSYGT
jgi:hypothetical protein